MANWLARFADGHASKRLGPLEWRTLEALWAQARPVSVRELQPEFPEIAYTTLMTTLDRLHRKNVLARTKRGRAFLYEPRLTRTEYDSARAANALTAALAADGKALGPLLSFFVQSVSDRSDGLLDDLEVLVRERQAEVAKHRS